MNDFCSCNEIKELLSPYLDGELDAKETKLVKKHLGQCLNCRRELDNLRRLSVLIKSSYSTSPLSARRKQKNMKKAVSSSIAALVFLVFLGWFSINMINTDKTSIIETDKPIYVRAEDYFLAGIYNE